jgi:cysteine desulfurase
VAAAVGFGAAAAELSGGGRLESEAIDAARNVDRLREAVEAIADVEIYGPSDRRLRLPHLLCIGVGGVEAEPILIGLDQAGVAAHSGSSCSSESLEPSPVLEAMGVDAEHSLRLSVGWSTTPVDLARATQALPRVVSGLRALMAGG